MKNFELKTLMGYENTLSNLQKGRFTILAEKFTRYEGEIYTNKDFICQLILEGYRPSSYVNNKNKKIYIMRNENLFIETKKNAL